MDTKKVLMVAIIALILAIAGYSIAESALSQEIAFEYLVNNTDLYAVGERTHGQSYTANNSAIQLFLTFHVVGTGAAITVDTNLSINGTVVADRDYRTSAGVGVHEHFSIIATIPKGAVYKVTNSSNLETIEWREYPIISGRNGTLSINQTIYNNYTNTTTGGGGVSFDGTVVDLNGSSLKNGSQEYGTFNHSNLTNLDYVNSGHTNFAASIQGTNYYLETTGSDSNDCLSVLSSCKTVTRIFNILKNQSILYGNISIHMGNGTFYETFTVPELFYDGYKVTIYGTLKETNLSYATSGKDAVFGTSGSYGSVTNSSATWTADAYKNKLLMNPTGQMAVISGNNATAINYTIQSDYFTKFSSGQPIIIKDWNTTIECNTYLTTSFTGCVTLSPRAEFVINSLKIKDNTTTGNGAAIIGDGQAIFNPRYSYLEGYGNGGTVYLSTLSYLNTYNSVFVGDGAVIRLEGSSRIFDRFSASNYILNGTVNSYKTAMLISSGSTGYLGEGYFIDGKTSPSGSKGVWSLDGSAMLVFQGFITNWNYGNYAQRNSLITEAGLPKYITVGVNYYPSIKSDNSSVQ